MSSEKDNPYFNMQYLLLDGRKPIYVMLNHRVAYLCWIDALKRRFIRPKAFLAHIDWHTDFQLGKDDLITKAEAISNENSEEQLKFVRDDLRCDNSNFIVPAMYRGLIGDALSIDHQQDEHEDNYGVYIQMIYETTYRKEFTDNNQCKHTFYFGGSSISGLVGYKGLLTDGCTHLDVHSAFDQAAKEKNIILDIDLDFFTYENDGREWSLNERNLKKTLWSEGFAYLLNRAKIVNIALEPACCGGSTECLNILACLSERLAESLGVSIYKPTLDNFPKELVI